MKNLIIFIFALVLSHSSDNTVNIEMVPIIEKGEKAEFIMGSTSEELENQPHRKNDPDYYYTDEKAHKVVLTTPYSISKYEITNNQFVDIMNFALNNNKVQIKDGDLYDQYNRKLLGITNLDDDKYLGVQHGIKITDTQLEVIYSKQNWPVHAVTWIGAITF